MLFMIDNDSVLIVHALTMMVHEILGEREVKG